MPIALELLVVIGIGLALLGLAIAEFSRTE
jgi:hypothetical protein